VSLRLNTVSTTVIKTKKSFESISLNNLSRAIFASFVCLLYDLHQGVKSESSLVIFNVFSHLKKSILGRSLEKYHFQSFNIDKVIQILNFAINSCNFLSLSK